jgi:putative aminopeptidase FrvX
MQMNKTLTHGYHISEEDMRWLAAYMEHATPPGNEMEGQRLWLELIKKCTDDYITDPYGNVAAILNPNEEFKVVIEAHTDVIAWYVHRITKDGFLHVKSNGGTDPGIAPSQLVNVRTSSGVVKGVFGWPAIHTRSKSVVEPTPAKIFVDCGCKSKHEVQELGIQIGDCVTYDSNFQVMNNNYLVGRGQDNKIGGFMIATVARLLREHNVRLPFSLYVVNSVQEEVGLRGASLMAERIKPHCAIITDVTHATRTPMVNLDLEGDIDLASGPVIIKSPSVHNKLRELIISTAQSEKIPYQLSVKSKKTGTDADAFAYSNGGTPAALISLPLRYMHTTVETTHRGDIENCISLMYAVLNTITPEFNFHYY